MADRASTQTTFQGVVTTGIYCRTDCAARPHPRNVVPFASPAAAEAAGFRACLRCRPYRAAASLGAVGPDLVCRAVHLVVGGALDGGTEDELARRIGVSARHLRRQFVEHVGTTPDGLARSRRAHFARRLLDDTDLPFAQVASAAGFGSVRQFNRACTEIFGFTPTELRARRRRADRLAADGGLALRLPFTPPLDGDALLRYLAARATPGVEVVADGTYRRTIEVDGDPGVLELWPHDDHVVLVAHLPHWEGLIHIVERARRLLGLDAPLPPLADLPARPGLRRPGCWDPFEIAVRAVVGQQVSVAAATTIMGRLAERFGSPVTGLDLMALTHLFPTPDALAAADLGGVGLTGARARTVGALADAVVTGKVVLDRSRPLDELVASLTALPGIGPWTAHYVALRLGEPDAWPGTDLVLRKRMAALGDPDPERWRPQRASAAIALWNLDQSSK